MIYSLPFKQTNQQKHPSNANAYGWNSSFEMNNFESSKRKFQSLRITEN